jgi:hypothetical protein
VNAVNRVVELIAGVTILVLLFENPTLPGRVMKLIFSQYSNVASLAHPPSAGG